MKHISFRSIDALCAQLLGARGSSSGPRIDKLVSDGIRHRVLDKASLPLIIRKVSANPGGWCLALRVLQSKQLDIHMVKRDENIWRIVDDAVPKNDLSKKSTFDALRAIYGVKDRVPRDQK